MSDKITIIERSIGDFPALIGKVRDGDKLSFLEKTAIKMLNGQERRQTSDALRVFSGVPDDIRIIFPVAYMKDNPDVFESGIENRMIWITRHFNLIGGTKPLANLPYTFFLRELEKHKSLLKSISKREDVMGPDAII